MQEIKEIIKIPQIDELKEAIKQGIYRLDVKKTPETANCPFIDSNPFPENNNYKIRTFQCGYYEEGYDYQKGSRGFNGKSIGSGIHDKLHSSIHLLHDCYKIDYSQIWVEKRYGAFFKSGYNNRADVIGKLPSGDYAVVELGTFTLWEKFFLINEPDVKYFIWDGQSNPQTGRTNQPNNFLLSTPKPNYFYVLSEGANFNRNRNLEPLPIPKKSTGKSTSKITKTITIDKSLLDWVDSEIDEKRFATISHAIELALYELKKSMKNN